MTRVSFSRRLSALAHLDPDRPAVTCGDESVSRRELDEWSNRLARVLASPGATVGDMVTISLPNSIDWLATAIAAWKLGAIPQPISSGLPAREIEEIVQLAKPRVVVGLDPAITVSAATIPLGYRPEVAIDASELPDAVSPAWKAPTSGGSTGRPKLILSGEPSLIDPDAPPGFGMNVNGCLVMPGPLYHNAPAVWCAQMLLQGGHVVLLARFDAAATLTAIERYKADMVYLVPTMMKRISRLPDEQRFGYDLSSLQIVWHLAEPCPAWLKRQWIEWLGADTIMELYAGTEAQAVTIITGTEWLAHEGSVGRPATGEISIADALGDPLPPGAIGEVWLRNTGSTPTYHYFGAEPRTREGGWESLGDMGSVDEEGYLYLADRSSDMILCGGANVYPAEVEAVIAEHPGVRSCAVIGLPDEDLGQRVHAIVEADAATLDELPAFVRERLVRYRCPRTWELVDVPLRSDAGKVRRSELRTERLR